jgi:hypothetical protein
MTFAKMMISRCAGPHRFLSQHQRGHRARLPRTYMHTYYTHGHPHNTVILAVSPANVDLPTSTPSSSCDPRWQQSKASKVKASQPVPVPARRTAAMLEDQNATIEPAITTALTAKEAEQKAKHNVAVERS